MGDPANARRPAARLLLLFVMGLASQAGDAQAAELGRGGRQQEAPPERGTLERARDEVHERGDSGDARDDDESDGGDESFWASLLWPIIEFTALAPFGVPASAAGDSNSCRGYFPPHPYSFEEAGYLVFDAPDLGDPWALRIAVEDGNDFSGLNRAGADILLSTTSRFGVQAAFNYYNERLDDGRDDLFMGDLNGILRFAQHEDFEFRAGLGFRWMADEDDADFGFNFTYAADFFPTKHLVVSAAVDLGNLGSAFVANPRGSVGFIIADWELYAGYNHLWVGSTELYGPMVGLRYWW